MVYEQSISNEKLLSVFSALDSLLSVHYASSTTVPKVLDLCAKATLLTKRRVDKAFVEQILAYDPQIYHVVRFGPKSLEYGLCSPKGTSPLQFGALLSSRKTAFEKLVSSCLAIPPRTKLSDVAIPLLEGHLSKAMNDLIGAQGVDVAKLDKVKPKIPRCSASTEPNALKSKFRIDKRDLSNNRRDSRHERIKLIDGLSLLERIKLKEKSKIALARTSMKEDYSLYIRSMAPPVYDILFELCLRSSDKRKLYKTIPMEKILSIVKDSLSSPMSSTEINDVFNELAIALPEKIEILSACAIHALRISLLDRERDLSIIQAIK